VGSIKDPIYGAVDVTFQRIQCIRRQANAIYLRKSANRDAVPIHP
jgi:hypothetical protein